MSSFKLQCGLLLLTPMDANDSPKANASHSLTHSHKHTHLTGCRSTAWTDHQTHPAAAGVAKSWPLSSIATLTAAHETIPPASELRTFNAGGLVGGVPLYMSVWVINVWVPARDCACAKRVGEQTGDAFFLQLCIGDGILCHMRTLADSELVLLSHCGYDDNYNAAALHYSCGVTPTYYLHFRTVTTAEKLTKATTPWT